MQVPKQHQILLASIDVIEIVDLDGHVLFEPVWVELIVRVDVNLVRQYRHASLGMVIDAFHAILTIESIVRLHFSSQVNLLLLTNVERLYLSRRHVRVAAEVNVTRFPSRGGGQQGQDGQDD